MRNNRSALMALLAAGGLWAYQNRGKIQGWVNNQRNQMSNQYGTEPSTGPTRRIGEDTLNSSSPRIYDESSNQPF